MLIQHFLRYEKDQIKDVQDGLKDYGHIVSFKENTRKSYTSLISKSLAFTGLPLVQNLQCPF
jgi:hypothetical protein